MNNRHYVSHPLIRLPTLGPVFGSADTLDVVRYWHGKVVYFERGTP